MIRALLLYHSYQWSERFGTYIAGYFSEFFEGTQEALLEVTKGGLVDIKKVLHQVVLLP